jgi:hypothetical protein
MDLMEESDLLPPFSQDKLNGEKTGPLAGSRCI